VFCWLKSCKKEIKNEKEKIVNSAGIVVGGKLGCLRSASPCPSASSCASASPSPCPGASPCPSASSCASASPSSSACPSPSA